ncbi:Uncharacterised protein [BD1-7 clade bacterium]|uniref:Uncharacterized protein n=1 Tax=BD1-7 clade bacterium TaxID=2029982 RepID=A0A5S9R0W0_9GAMM|nr:Uncharacterised protein [BD1-7 clade bacterium]
MNITSGHFYAAAVNSSDPAFEIALEANSETNAAEGRRIIPSMVEKPVDDLDMVKDGIDTIKKQGFGGVKKLFKKAVDKAMEEIADKPKPAPAKPDPLDPEFAHRLPHDVRVRYAAIEDIQDLEQSTDYYEYRGDSVYGILHKVADDLYREISFTVPTDEYVEKHFAAEAVGHSVRDWRREDARLHRMRVYFLSTDKAKAEKAAADANFDQIKHDFTSVDFSTCRDGLSTRFNFPELKLDPKSGALSLNFVTGWYLPLKTLEGRDIQYRWDALRVSVKQGDTLIRRKVCWSKNRGRYCIQTAKNIFELADGGYMAELEAGNYTLEIEVYNETIMSYPFTVQKIETTDSTNQYPHYFSLVSAYDDYARLEITAEHCLNLHYPLKRLIESKHSVDEINIEITMEKDGQAWPEWKHDHYQTNGLTETIEVNNTPAWTLAPLKLVFPFGDEPELHKANPAPDGQYRALLTVDGELFDTVSFEFKDGQVISQAFAGSATMPAEFVYTEEHTGVFIPLTK